MENNSIKKKRHLGGYMDNNSDSGSGSAISSIIPNNQQTNCI